MKIRVTQKQQLATALVVTALAGLGVGFLATRYLGRNTSIAIGGSVFVVGVGLQVAQSTTAKPKRRTP
ncbi:MAG: hypothetical protein KME30_26955 [Iphinoe sp. HA4291-MV1]|jgi:FtsH-binding integral membrane protein|nr:hypothetical protein [Iphinoe sp. HA4291-MV1]